MKAGVAALMAVASMALAAPEARAHGSVSAQVVFQAPVAVVGFSYGDPYFVGHVHRGPIACAHGPLYYYPTYGVYGHYYPRHKYVRYSRPYYVRGHNDGWYRKGGYRHHGNAGQKASYRRGNGKGGNGNHDGTRDGRRRKGSGGHSVRGHKH